MLEIATLGLLQKESLHGYRLKHQLELFMGSCISVNYGTIYPLLKRLEERGAIAVMTEEEGEAGSARKIYSITPDGLKLWKQKMLDHPHESWVNARSRFMIKFFFFNYLESFERSKLLKHRLTICQLRLDSPEVDQLAADRYQTQALQYCKSIIQMEIQWLTEKLAEEESEYLPKGIGQAQ